MMRASSRGKLLSFPSSALIREATAQNWTLRILETRDNLVNALGYIGDEYDAMLAGKPITAADEILARVETILRNDERISSCTVAAKIGIHGPPSRDARPKVLLPFLAVKARQ
jgi:hypothetical protein